MLSVVRTDRHTPPPAIQHWVIGR